jgi:prevent-host-death family protein
MATIPQRELRNNISEVLRRAERGERLVVTVGGRPVAELGPVSMETTFASPEQLNALLAATPVDTEWGATLAAERAAERNDHPDPWRPEA